MVEKIAALLGGDKRELQVVPALQTAGWKVQVYGLPKNELPSGIVCCDTIKDAVRDVSVVVLPLPGIRNNGRLHAPFIDNPIVKKNDFEDLPQGTPIVTGVISDYLYKLAGDLELIVYGVADNDRVAVPNAIPTAEAAIRIIMENTEITIDGMRILVMGYGRVGEALAARLKALGAMVTVTNRNPGRYAAAAKDGYRLCPWQEKEKSLGKFDVIFNTIPALVLDKEALSMVNKKSLIIDLASSPGGVDFAEAEKLGIKTIHALGLPGKYFPVTAGKILAGFYPSFLARVINGDTHKNKGGVSHENR